ncbi:N-acetylglucosamine kinase [Microbacterium sp. P01]|uniref:N-acetylglucosamine kinase n=1 Tax=unclassified Microbacterium TaxID=2609290 RepID=UPI00366B9B01
MTTRAVLAIDAGQSGMKVRLVSGRSSEDLLFGGIRTHEALLPQVADVVRAALARTGAHADVVTAGISGLTDRDADPDVLLSMLADTGIHEVVLAHDSTTSFLGALGDAHGSVVASGTGVVTLAVGADAVARVDGWGYLMGDAGSGYWIGREALEAVMRAFDGRGEPTALTEVVRGHWPDLTQAYIQLQGDEGRVQVVASFAADVARLAVQGDEVAEKITRQAAHELAQSVIASLRRVARPEDATLSVCAIGGVFRSRLLRESFDRELDAADLSRGAAPIAIRLVEPRGVGIDGAVALADLSPRHPLSAVVHHAEAARRLA